MNADRLTGALEVLGARIPGPVALYTAPAREPLLRTFANRGIDVLTGCPSAVFRDDVAFWPSLIQAEDRPSIRKASERLSAAGEITLEYRIRLPDGETLWVRDHMALREPSGAADAVVVGLLLDVTELRRLRGDNTALEERIIAAQRMESMGAFVGEAAHDFNNLLTAILSSVLVLRDELSSAQAQKDLDVIESAAGRGAALIRQLTAFVGRSRRLPGPLNPLAVVRELEPVLRRSLGQNTTLTVEGPADTWEVRADRARLEQVALNLVRNAREVLPGGGTVHISTRNVVPEAPLRAAGGDLLQEGRYVVLSVQDSGPGVPVDLRDRIFDPFYTNKEDEGACTGFGLTAVRRIARSYGGAVRVGGFPGAGAAFEVYLPVSDATGVLQDQPRAREGGVGARILVVEDDEAVRGMLERALRQLGYAVVAASSSAEALEIFHLVGPSLDLVVCDVVLPDRPGPVLVEALCKRRPSLGVVYMSGYGPDVLASHTEHLDVAPLLRKPFAPADLQEAVTQALASPAARRGERSKDIG
jgi:two-component system cell cycle sensor histidine kinase/response regulator CckA